MGGRREMDSDDWIRAKTSMLADTQRDRRPAVMSFLFFFVLCLFVSIVLPVEVNKVVHRWRPVLNAAKVG